MDYTKVLSYAFKGNEWILVDNDLNNLQWLSDTPKPTKEEIEIAKQNIEKEIANQSTNKAAAEAKLVALGLTVDDLKALGLA